MNVANTLTFSRLLMLIPIAITIYHEKFLYTLILFAIAGLTDMADGYVARKFNQKTKLGAFLDPVTDKLLIFTGFTLLAVKGIIPVWFFTIVFAKDLAALIATIVLASKKISWEPRPNIVGKIAVLLQALIILFGILHAGFFRMGLILSVTVLICAFFTCLSAYFYTLDFASLVKCKGKQNAC